MRTATFVGGLTATLLLTASAGLAQPSFEVMGHFGEPIIGNPSVTDISANGRFVTGHAPPLAGGETGYRYERGVGRFDYAPPQFAFRIIAPQGISGDGQYVVGYLNATNPGPQRVFRSRQNGAFDVYTPVPGANSYGDVRVNADGSKVIANASFDTGSASLTRPYVYANPTTFAPLALPATASAGNAGAFDISDDGQTIIGSALDSSRGETSHAFAWRASTGSSFLTVPEGTLASGAATVSRDGNQIGGARRRLTGEVDFVRWSGESLITAPVPSRPGGSWDFLTATHITGDGRMATGELGYIGESGGFIRAGFVWTEQFGVQLLRDYLISAQVPLPFPAENVIGSGQLIVSDDGGTLAGIIGFTPSGGGQSQVANFVLTIPTPATGSLIAAFALASMRRRRHSV